MATRSSHRIDGFRRQPTTFKTTAQEGYSPDGVPDLGKTTWMVASPCAECHGIFADGVMEIAQQPQGADLRTGTLSPEEMFAVIKCGPDRPPP